MKRILITALVILSLLLPSPRPARADLWGGDVVVLAQILANAIQQLAQLKQILSAADDTLGLLRDINRGINDSLNMAETLGVRIDPGLYRDLNSIDAVIGTIDSIFGRVPDSKIATVQRNTDRTAAEAIVFNNELNEYTRRIDRLGEDIKKYSHAVSPGGAAKLTAQSVGVLIHVMNQQIRATGQGLKLQAQALAIQNKQEKDKTAQYLAEGRKLKAKMQTIEASFNAPRF